MSRFKQLRIGVLLLILIGGNARIAMSLEECVVGPETAREIHGVEAAPGAEPAAVSR